MQLLNEEFEVKLKVADELSSFFLDELYNYRIYSNKRRTPISSRPRIDAAQSHS